MKTIDYRLKKFWKKLEPVHGVIYFAVILLCANAFWKLTITDDDSSQFVKFLGMNISQPFIFITQNIASTSAYILENWLNVPAFLHGTTIYFDTKVSINVVWGCSGLKQMFIFFCIIAFYKGSWLNKLWFIPSGFIILHIFNIFRIVVISYFVRNDISLMWFLHDFLFKCLFYGLIFLIWVLWEEKFVKKSKNNETPISKTATQTNDCLGIPSDFNEKIKKETDE
jgi:exosortase/archaeosortase family protein